MSIPRPSLYLNFASSPILDRRLAVSRATSAGYFDALGSYRVAPANALPRDHDLTTGLARGSFIGRQRTNTALHNRDMTNGVWTNTNITAAKNQTGLDGAASAASSLTATSTNGTSLQAVTLASASVVFSAYVKRLAGTSLVYMTQDGGSTWTAISVTSDWARFALPAVTLANPTIGFRLAGSGDAIAVDLAQVDSDSFVGNTTPAIETAGSSVTVNTDAVSVAGGGWLNPTEGTVLIEFTGLPTTTAGNTRYPFAIGVTTGASDHLRMEYGTTAGLRFRAYSGASMAAESTVAVNMGAPICAVGAYKAGQHFVAANGTLGNIVAGVAVPAFAQTLYVGGASNAALISAFRGHVRRLIYWPRQLTTAQCQALSA